MLLGCALLSPIEPARAECAPELAGVSCALLCDAATGKTVLEKNADEPAEFAGLVRLPALILICRAFDGGAICGNTPVTVSREAAAVRGATAFLAPNERISADLLLKAAVMLNAGDAVCALMQEVCSDPAEEVNALLAGLGIEKRAEGGMGEGLVLTAREVAALCLELVKSPSFLKYSSIYTDSLPHEKAPETELVNPNRLVRHYSGCFGVATGSVRGSDYCGAFIARRGSTALLAVVAGASGSDARFSAARGLLDHGFSAFRTVELNTDGDEVAVLPVTGGLERTVSVVTAACASALLPVNAAKVTSELELPESVAAPIEEGAVLGRLVILDPEGNELGSVPLAAANSVPEAGWWDRVMLMLSRWSENRKL